jgi:hypothetical protein
MVWHINFKNNLGKFTYKNGDIFVGKWKNY